MSHTNPSSIPCTIPAGQGDISTRAAPWSRLEVGPSPSVVTSVPQSPTWLQLPYLAPHLAPVTPVLQDLEGQKKHRHHPAQQRGLVVSKAKQFRPGHPGRAPAPTCWAGHESREGLQARPFCLGWHLLPPQPQAGEKQPRVGHACLTPSTQAAHRGASHNGHVLKTASTGFLQAA